MNTYTLEKGRFPLIIRLCKMCAFFLSKKKKKVTELSCSLPSEAQSLTSLQDNPYVKPSMSVRTALLPASGTGRTRHNTVLLLRLTVLPTAAWLRALTSLPLPKCAPVSSVHPQAPSLSGSHLTSAHGQRGTVVHVMSVTLYSVLWVPLLCTGLRGVRVETGMLICIRLIPAL